MFTGDVIRSSTMDKALREVPETHAVIVVAANLTDEARTAANRRGALILTTSDFAWTDISYVSIRQGRAKFTTEELQAAHQHARANRPAIESCSRCGCFSCLALFPAVSVLTWVKSGAEAETGVCPECEQQSVVPETIAQDATWELWDLLLAMKEYWFPERNSDDSESAKG